MLRLSSVTGTDLNANIERRGELFKRWKIATADMPKYLDKLYVAAQESGVGVDQLMAAAEKSGPNMRQFNFSFDESVALLATFDKAGLDTATAPRPEHGLKPAQVNTVKQGLKVVESRASSSRRYRQPSRTKPSPAEKSLQKTEIKTMHRRLRGHAKREQSPGRLPAPRSIDQNKDLDGRRGHGEREVSVFGAKAGPARRGHPGRHHLDERASRKRDWATPTAPSTRRPRKRPPSGAYSKRWAGKNQVKVAIEPLATGLFGEKRAQDTFKTIAPYISTFIALVADVLHLSPRSSAG